MSLSTDSRPSISTDAEPWGERALCFRPDSDPDMWWSDDRTTQGVARHMCLTHCPVLDQCSRFYRVGGGETAAGITYKVNGKPMSLQPKLPRVCIRCYVVN